MARESGEAIRKGQGQDLDLAPHFLKEGQRTATSEKFIDRRVLQSGADKLETTSVDASWRRLGRTEGIEHKRVEKGYIHTRKWICFKHKTLFVYALTPCHNGRGASSIMDQIDLVDVEINGLTPERIWRVHSNALGTFPKDRCPQPRTWCLDRACHARRDLPKLLEDDRNGPCGD